MLMPNSAQQYSLASILLELKTMTAAETGARVRKKVRPDCGGAGWQEMEMLYVLQAGRL